MTKSIPSSVLGLLFFAALTIAGRAAPDPLPSWADGKSKKAIVDFVNATVSTNSARFVAPAERVAVFDNDGTLWAEQPMYFQMLFTLDRLKQLAPQHPEWRTNEPFASTLRGDFSVLAAAGVKGMLELTAATHAGMTIDEFNQIVTEWLAQARHPRFKRHYPELVYQPMLELLDYLRSNRFNIYIVSGGGTEFMRAFAEKVYGVPPDHIIGSRIKTKFEMRGGQPVIMRLPELDFIDDKDTKPLAIANFIGRRPIAAFGNSDGDLQMLQWTAGSHAPHFCLYIHHDDATREWAYDRDSGVGRLDKGLDEAGNRGWTVVSMKNDWKRVFAFESPEQTPTSNVPATNGAARAKP